MIYAAGFVHLPAHAAINIDYRGYSVASIGPLICRKFVVPPPPPSVTRRANCLQYSSNSVSRRICARSRVMTHHDKCRRNNWTNRTTRSTAPPRYAVKLIKLKRVLCAVRAAKDAERKHAGRYLPLFRRWPEQRRSEYFLSQRYRLFDIPIFDGGGGGKRSDNSSVFALPSLR